MKKKSFNQFNFNSKKNWIGIETIIVISIFCLAINELIQVFPEIGAIEGDAFWTYMPNARKLLENPWIFLTTDPASYTVPPLSYFWPALLGANQFYIQIANSFLFLASILLIWSFVRSFAGSLAAMLALVCFVFHPAILYHAPQIMTESPYLFGFSLTLFSIGKYICDSKKSKQWLVLMAIGLTITLLLRPVFQYIILIFIAVFSLDYLLRKKLNTSKKIIIALASTFLIPILVITKNGIYFDVWSISTGSGSGLFYGLSPYKNGIEPIFSNFSYDADVIPRGVDPSTQGHPLYKISDNLNKNTSLEIIKNTTLLDNVRFILQKAHTWVFTSTPELYSNIQYRWIRLIELFFIFILSIGSICIFLSKKNKNIASKDTINFLVAFYGLAFVLSLMTAQLSLVLYNSRYSAYFVEPFYIVLMSLSFGAIVSNKIFKKFQSIRILIGIVLFVLIAYLSYALMQHAVRREVWEMDANRPGPSEVMISSEKMQQIDVDGMDSIGLNEWTINKEPATLTITFDATATPSNDELKDAFWRMRFAFDSAANSIPSRCEKASIGVNPAQDPINWYPAPPVIFLRADGESHNYMISANGTSRPQAIPSAKFVLTLNCPVGSTLRFEGLEMRRSTLTDAAIEHFLKGTPIDPYLREKIN